MTLAEKMFSRFPKWCGIRDDCRTTTGQDLFSRDWEVFVIKRDERSGKLDWYTLCCEAVNENCNSSRTAACGA